MSVTASTTEGRALVIPAERRACVAVMRRRAKFRSASDIIFFFFLFFFFFFVVVCGFGFLAFWFGVFEVGSEEREGCFFSSLLEL